MCSIANPFDTPIRKFYAFFCPECLDLVNHLEKLIFFQNEVSVCEVELWLHIKSIES